MPRVLVIDDDRELAGMLVDYLTPEGFEVDTAETGEQGLTRALTSGYELIILDVMLPGLNGLEVLRRLRTASQCPVIMLTARGQEVDRIVGLEVGADDYLAKPFSARELLARMHAVLRRTRAAPTGAGEPGAGDVLAVGDIVMDVRARTVRRTGQVVALTSVEFDVLRVLLAAAGDVVSRDELARQALQREHSPFDRSIDNHVSSLRKKLGPRIGDVERIKAVRNAGYVYARTPREQ
jgi:two-component system response regulator CpxR